jgi:hypothetical protein
MTHALVVQWAWVSMVTTNGCGSMLLGSVPSHKLQPDAV